MTPQATELDIAKIEQKEQDALTRVQGWTIETQEEYKALDGYLVGLLALKKEIEADFSESEDAARKTKKSATEALAAIVAQKDGHLGKVEDARRLGKLKLDQYDTKQAEILRIENDRIAAANKKKAEDAALEAAALAEKSGDREKAEAILQEPMPFFAPPTAYTPQRSTIIQTRWSATITDPDAVKNAIKKSGELIAKSKSKEAQEAVAILRQVYAAMPYLAWNTVALNRLAVATKGAVEVMGVKMSSRKV